MTPVNQSESCRWLGKVGRLSGSEAVLSFDELYSARLNVIPVLKNSDSDEWAVHLKQILIIFQIHLLIGKVDSAISDFKKAVELNSNFPIAFVQKCYTDYRYAYQMGDKAKVDEVMKKFDEAIKNFPKCVECYVLYAQVLCDQGEYERADGFYVKALEVDPDNPTTLVHRALLTLQWKGDLAQARTFITQALEIDDKCELAYENLATIEVQTGNLKRGVELFDKAIPLAKTEMEMAHLFSLRDAAVAQLKIVEKMGINIPNLGSL
ncbi:mitochondrial import receptor subunit TOM70-like [Penaeus indicus]|uniref:mitochondrial import receptor subunit TOM70-like n=1 Tax=Penaeus indicus TaxID=29960 RepID=UPI00300DAEEF